MSGRRFLRYPVKVPLYISVKGGVERGEDQQPTPQATPV